MSQIEVGKLPEDRGRDDASGEDEQTGEGEDGRHQGKETRGHGAVRRKTRGEGGEVQV
ncbi:hypothetical protein PR003_g8922 [Phytophthora rubi]|uniref:Uncharacterized protein n=1 Tax=Phytophthora rubi TaxID=129364 RepID=A0A6A4FFS1_9STRA|nr:hypothetical protein PR002_g8935 [Phytophthora rubi]KAE9343545.1 hypothetical protein PR003_g8922 [Phytophthora rubi]